MEETTAKTRILFVEDDPNLSMILKDYLEMMGYLVVHAGDGDSGLKLFNSRHFDLAILDVMMPKKDGFTLAGEIRQKNTAIPIIFLTAKNLKEDRIRGFQQGCDDYITKPFSTEELSLRIKAILKRCWIGNEKRTEEDSRFYTLGHFKFDSNNLTLTSPQGEQRLTRKEANLLQLLCQHKNMLLSREVALETVWGENDYFIGRSMDVFITKLRKYLKTDPEVNIINVHGIGFKLEVNE